MEEHSKYSVNDSYFGGVQPQGQSQTHSKTYIFLGFTNSGFLEETSELELDIFLWNRHRLHVDSFGINTKNHDVYYAGH